MWRERGSPHVGFLKIDVEGNEVGALRGAMAMVAVCRPTILMETTTPATHSETRALLESLGYRVEHPDGFHPTNHLFLPDA